MKTNYKILIGIMILIIIVILRVIFIFQLDDIDGCNKSVAMGLYICDNFDSIDKTDCVEKCYMSYGILSGEYVSCDEEHNQIRLKCGKYIKAIKLYEASRRDK